MHTFNFFLKIDSAVDFLFLVPKKGYVSDFKFSLSLSFFPGHFRVGLHPSPACSHSSLLFAYGGNLYLGHENDVQEGQV